MSRVLTIDAARARRDPAPRSEEVALLEGRYRGLGFLLTPEELVRALDAYRTLERPEGDVLDEDLLEVLHEGSMETVPEAHRLVELDVRCGGPVSSARVVLSRGDGGSAEARAQGSGPVEAAFAALAAALDFRIVVEDVDLGGGDARVEGPAEVRLRARIDGHTFRGFGEATDVVLAAALAYLLAVNKAEQARALEARHLALTADAWAV